MFVKVYRISTLISENLIMLLLLNVVFVFIFSMSWIALQGILVLAKRRSSISIQMEFTIIDLSRQLASISKKNVWLVSPIANSILNNKHMACYISHCLPYHHIWLL